MFLVQEAPGFRRIHGFSAAEVLDENDRVGNPALWAYDQALQITGLCRFRIADLIVFVDGKSQRTGAPALTT
jgi:hypothetical protein